MNGAVLIGVSYLIGLCQFRLSIFLSGPERCENIKVTSIKTTFLLRKYLARLCKATCFNLSVLDEKKSKI